MAVLVGSSGASSSFSGARLNPQLLIDAIVRQTTVLLARLSTVEGVRSPLGHIANEVFVGLVAELKNQGVSNKTIADMFGMTRRSYRLKVQRLGESKTTRGVTLWAAVQRFLAERGSATREELVAGFKNDEAVLLRGILNDLVESGLIVRTGRGDEARYRTASTEEPGDLPNGEQVAAQQAFSRVGGTAGWEAAAVDHHRAALNALAAKLTKHTRTSTIADEVGGTTLTFDLWPGHPYEQEVRSLLRSTRARVLPLWERLGPHGRQHPDYETYQVHYYFGQYVVEEEPSG